MQAALDSAALNLVRDSDAVYGGQLTPKATALFNAVFSDPDASNIQVEAVYDPSTAVLTLNSSANVSTTFMGLVSINSMQVATVSKARDKVKSPCVIASDPTGPQTFKVPEDGLMNVPNCNNEVMVLGRLARSRHLY